MVYTEDAQKINQLFSETWMMRFSEIWNSDQSIIQPLSAHSFSAEIGYGLLDDAEPLAVITIVDGYIEYAGEYLGQELNWDIRANAEDWQQWLHFGLPIARLGLMLSSKRLQFKQGNYRQLLRATEISGAFLRSFELMHTLEEKHVN